MLTRDTTATLEDPGKIFFVMRATTNDLPRTRVELGIMELATAGLGWAKRDTAKGGICLELCVSQFQSFLKSAVPVDDYLLHIF
jgi:hypothetical protein